MTEDLEASVPRCEEPISIFGSLDVTTLNESLHVLALLPTLARYRQMLAVALQPRGYSANLRVGKLVNRPVAGYIVGGLLDGSSPRRRTS